MISLRRWDRGWWGPRWHRGWWGRGHWGLAAVASIRAGIAALVFEWRFRFILGSDNAVTVGIEPAEEFVSSFWGQFLEERAGLEFLEADAAALVRIQFPQALHGWSLLAMGSGHAVEFLAAELAVPIFIQALKQVQAFFIRQFLDARHRVEFLFREESIVILVSGFPRFHKHSLRTMFGATVGRWWCRIAAFGLGESHDWSHHAGDH